MSESQWRPYGYCVDDCQYMGNLRALPFYVRQLGVGTAQDDLRVSFGLLSTSEVRGLVSRRLEVEAFLCFECSSLLIQCGTSLGEMGQ